MPWIFLTLMLANIVYFGWNFISAGQTPVRPISTQVAQEGEKITLLQERKRVVSRSSPDPIEEVPAIPEEKPVEVALAAQCFSVGPFATNAAADGFVGRMRSKGFTVRVDQRKAEGKDYWIYVPPFTNRSKAEERLRDLRAKGIDSFIVGEGRFINAISLGHFSKKELAETFREKMTSAGVVVEYREMANEGSTSWVYVAPASSKADLRAGIERELAKNDGLRREAASCEE